MNVICICGMDIVCEINHMFVECVIWVWSEYDLKKDLNPSEIASRAVFSRHFGLLPQ